jgi:hypothetical protein
MRCDRHTVLGGRSRSPHHQSALSLVKPAASKRVRSKRVRVGSRNQQLPFIPPENWHEPREDGRGYRIIVQAPGSGYRHVVTPADVRQRLAEVPTEFLRPLEVVQFSRMTRKKQSFPCYGLQWGSSLYLYPIEDDLVEYYHQPPKPSQLIEARMYGGRWIQESATEWKLVWTEAAIKDFYLNNILIHELGHLIDDRNDRSVDRERFAEWFAVHHGYRATSHLRKRKKVVQRHVRRGGWRTGS